MAEVNGGLQGIRQNIENERRKAPPAEEGVSGEEQFL
jgi:hypothetical protein